MRKFLFAAFVLGCSTAAHAQNWEALATQEHLKSENWKSMAGDMYKAIVQSRGLQLQLALKLHHFITMEHKYKLGELTNEQYSIVLKQEDVVLTEVEKLVPQLQEPVPPFPSDE
jgi:hypothetical protein